MQNFDQIKELLAKMGGAGAGAAGVPTIKEEDEEDVPELVENFEAESK